MADDADRAQVIEMAERAEALRRARQPAAETPRIDALGHRLCVDCAEPIGSLRLAAVPNAVRCTECQIRREHWSHGRG